MAGRILLGALLAAVAMIIWGFIYWAALPFASSSISNIPNEDAVRSALSQNLTESGAYMFPGMDMNAADKAAAEKTFRDKALAGPIGLIIYKKEGSEPMAPATIGTGFIHAFIAAVLIGILLAMALPALPMYGQRVLFVFVAGLFAAYATGSGYYNWWNFPLGFTIANGIYTALAWLISGLILARVVSEGGPARIRMSSTGGIGGRGNAYTFMPPVFIKK